MSSRYADLGRPPLQAAALRAALVVDGGPWTEVEVVEHTGSTNADVVQAAASGLPEGLVVVAEHQSAGRGRVGRAWEAPPRSGLTFSVLLRPPAETRPQWGWLPLLTGLAVAAAAERIGAIEARLKWPNDVLVGERKLAGILAEVSGDAVVVGVGLNVSLREDELPVPNATSLALEGALVVDRDPVLRAVLRELARTYGEWRAAGADATRAGLLAAYRGMCATLGRDVTVHLPDGATRSGRAVAVDETGQLVLDTPDGRVTLAAGDVVHVR